MEKRKCSFCKKEYELSVENFNRVKAKWFRGFSYRCRNCNKNQDKEKVHKLYIKRRKYHLDYQKKYKEKYRERIKATNIIKVLIEQKKITPQKCEVCGDKKADAHHPDYSKPLEIVWLCRSHHRKTHHYREL